LGGATSATAAGAAGAISDVRVLIEHMASTSDARVWCWPLLGPARLFLCDS